MTAVRARRVLAASALAVLGCSRSDPGIAATSASVPSGGVAGAKVATAARGATTCGNTPCRIFPDAVSAFRAVLAERPRVLGVGEAHTLAGAGGVESATARFTRDLLPLLSGHATDIVVEALVPNPKCEKTSRAAKKEQKVVTDRQSPKDQEEFVALGHAAVALGIRPFALEPTCEDLARIAKGGAEAVAGSLEAITRLSTEKLRGLLQERGGSPDAEGIIVLYGGATHNDAAPATGKEAWSYGPVAKAASGGRYTEVDLIVPEYVKKTPAWESLPWFSSYDPAAHPREATLFDVAPSSFVVIFPATEAPPP